MIHATLTPLDYRGNDDRKPEVQITMRSFLNFPSDPDIVWLRQSESMFLLLLSVLLQWRPF